MSNPDVPERFANNWPLREDEPYDTWWQHTAEMGYADFSPYDDEASAASAIVGPDEALAAGEAYESFALALCTRESLIVVKSQFLPFPKVDAM